MVLSTLFNVALSPLIMMEGIRVIVPPPTSFTLPLRVSAPWKVPPSKVTLPLFARVPAPVKRPEPSSVRLEPPVMKMPSPASMVNAPTV